MSAGSRTIVFPLPRGIIGQPLERQKTHLALSAVYEDDGNTTASQIVYAAYDALVGARRFFHNEVHATFLRWRIEVGAVFICLGLGNSHGFGEALQRLPELDLQRPEDPYAMVPPIWGRQDGYCTVTRNTR